MPTNTQQPVQEIEFIRYNQLKDLLDQIENLFEEMSDKEKQESINYATERINQLK